jgi:thioredoxin-related protein
MLGGVAVAADAGAGAAAGLEGFQKTYADAQKQAKETGKPMYLHFTTTWCGWCRKIEQDCYAVADGKKALEKFVPATLDCTVPQGQEPAGETKINIDLMEKFGGSGYPFLVILTPEGDLLKTWAGYKPLPEFVKELEDVSKTFEEYKEFQAYAAKADKASYEYNAKAMKLYARLENWAKAAEAAVTVRKLDPKDAKGDAAQSVSVQLQTASADKQADSAKIKALVDELVTLDAGNEKGLLEKALWNLAMGSYRASRTRDADVRKAKLTQTVETLTLLLEKGKKLANPQDPYGLMAAAYATMGQFDEAQKALEKGIAVDPNSPAAGQLKGMLERVAQAKEKMAAQSQPAAPKKD